MKIRILASLSLPRRSQNIWIWESECFTFEWINKIQQHSLNKLKAFESWYLFLYIMFPRPFFHEDSGDKTFLWFTFGDVVSNLVPQGPCVLVNPGWVSRPMRHNTVSTKLDLRRSYHLFSYMFYNIIQSLICFNYVINQTFWVPIGKHTMLSIAVKYGILSRTI